MSTVYLGPVFKENSEKDRIKFPLEANETPSVVLPIPTTPENTAQSVEVIARAAFPNMSCPSEREFIISHKEGIQDHLENRIQLFWMQLLMVYRTNLNLSYSTRALHQAGLLSAPSPGFALQEAHSSTLPCLLVNDGTNVVVFGQDSFFYKAQNTTVNAPAAANRLDTWLDTSGEAPLRDKAIVILQGVSTGALAPHQGIYQFVNCLITQIVGFQLKHDEKSPQKLVSKFYFDATAVYQKALVGKDSEIIKTLSFQRGFEGPINDAFFEEAQKPLREQFHQDMRIQKLCHGYLERRYLSKTQKAYARLYANSPELKELLIYYFCHTSKEQVQEDWKAIAHLKASNIRSFSPQLISVIKKVQDLAKSIYGITRLGHFGAIIESMLFQASTELFEKPVYSIADLDSRGMSTRIRTKTSRKKV